MVNTAKRCYQRKHTQSNGCQKEMSFVSYFWLQRRWKIRLLIKDLRHWYAGSKGNTWDFNFKCFLLSHRLTVFLTKLGSYIIIGRLCHSSIQPLAYTRLSEYLSAAWWFVCCTQPITFIWCKGDLCRDNEVNYIKHVFCDFSGTWDNAKCCLMQIIRTGVFYFVLVCFFFFHLPSICLMLLFWFSLSKF